MRLKELLADTQITSITPADLANREITGVTKDSREVGRGFVFFATDSSRSFVPDALNKGAAAIVADQPLPDVPCLVVAPDIRILLARMAARLYGFPSRELTVTGITGTNGKTTITYLMESIVRAASKKAGVIGTISYRYGDTVMKRPNTTPESVEIQSLMRAMKDAGTDHAIMEVSSHALDQGRVAGVDFDCAVFTNLTHDHLDYHGDFEHYRMAKTLLFHDYLPQSCKAHKHAIVNADDPSANFMTPPAPIAVLRYSTRNSCDASLISFQESITGLSLRITLKGTEMQLTTPLLGTFNIANILAAALFGCAMDIPHEAIKNGVEGLAGVPGRLERVASGKGFHIFVDYAHTPDALAKTIETLNAVRSGRLIVVFGCGGDRDRTKRPVMGRIASQLADYTFITSDNPRSEEPRSIIDEIRTGFAANSFRAIENRKEAIGAAIAMARENDVVLIAGKGHEDYQIIGGVSYPFSDRQVAEEYLHVAG
jgi:UDP-N-acetylmuramoyl-L-alanyl-D-glutamate--2,6-diaminopimelate ligase